MRQICLLSFLFFMHQVSFAQTRDDKNTEIEIGYGASLATGDFKSTDPHDSLSAFAINGTQVRGSIRFLFSKFIGAEFKVAHGSHRIDEDQLREKYKALAASLNGTLSGLSSDRWKYTSYLVGPCLGYRTRTFGFDVDVLAGITNATMPETEIAVYDSTQTNALQLVIESAPSSSFGLDAGAGIRYYVSDLMLISLRGSYFTSKQKFKDVKTVTNFSDDEMHDYERRISSVNITFGIGFRF